jgi:hypothetical protein
LSDDRRTEARSANIERPEGVVLRFQVRPYNVEPSESVRACNLLAKDWYFFTLSVLYEVEEGRPKVPLISNPCFFACRAERLARAGTGPCGAIIGPSGKAEGVGPYSKAGEEMALGESHKLIWLDILDTPCVNFARRNQTFLN